MLLTFTWNFYIEPGNEATILPIICASFLTLKYVLAINSHRFLINYFSFNCVIKNSILTKSIVYPKV